jgi:hypothetical protein
MGVVGRLLVMAVGYVLALCAGGATLVVAAPQTSLFDPSAFVDPFDALVRAATILALVMEVPVVGAAVLAIAAVVVGELLALRSWTYHVPAWGAAAASAGTPAWLWQAGAPEGVAADVMIAFLATGFVAGFVYWFVAGRGA